MRVVLSSSVDLHQHENHPLLILAYSPCLVMQYGGAAYLFFWTTTTCFGCYFTGNSAKSSANDVYINSGTLSTSGSTICESSDGTTLSTNSGTYYNYNCGGSSPPTPSPPTPLPTATAQPTGLFSDASACGKLSKTCDALASARAVYVHDDGRAHAMGVLPDGTVLCGNQRVSYYPESPP